ncbi:MAG: PEP-CTERM sorting domain-containing protein [Pirellulales bacterium]|nr:PEP-CTERM sorting domain-containing protein [Pirellulales bacterium]
MTLLQLAISDVDSVGTGYSGLVPDSVEVNVYSDILNDVGKLKLTLGPDYVYGAVIDGLNNDLDNFGVTIAGGVLSGISDIEVRFSLQVIPEPAGWLLMMTGAGAIAAGARRRYRRQKC